MLIYKPAKTGYFYVYAGLMTISGWLWFLWALYSNSQHGITACFFKNITNHPCPACGSTTSLMMLTKGEWQMALMTNPLGYVVAIGLLLLPLWLLADLLTEKTTLYHAVSAFDNKVRQRPLLLIPILLPVIINWIWNLMKM